jgi:predicted DNA-binding protein with PD1-like motif
MKKQIVLLMLALLSEVAQARDVPVVNSASCYYVNGRDPFILALKKGEKIPDAILQCAHDVNMKAASLSGLGLLKDPIIAYYNINKKELVRKDLTGIYELTSLNGNLALLDGKPSTHINANLADSEYQLIGGQFIEGTVATTAEITITPLHGVIHKKPDPNLNINVMVTD